MLFIESKFVFSSVVFLNCFFSSMLSFSYYFFFLTAFYTTSTCVPITFLYCDVMSFFAGELLNDCLNFSSISLVEGVMSMDGVLLYLLCSRFFFTELGVDLLGLLL